MELLPILEFILLLILLVALLIYMFIMVAITILVLAIGILTLIPLIMIMSTILGGNIYFGLNFIKLTLEDTIFLIQQKVSWKSSDFFNINFPYIQFNSKVNQTIVYSYELGIICNQYSEIKGPYEFSSPKSNYYVPKNNVSENSPVLNMDNCGFSSYTFSNGDNVMFNISYSDPNGDAPSETNGVRLILMRCNSDVEPIIINMTTDANISDPEVIKNGVIYTCNVDGINLIGKWNYTVEAQDSSGLWTSIGEDSKTQTFINVIADYGSWYTMFNLMMGLAGGLPLCLITFGLESIDLYPWVGFALEIFGVAIGLGCAYVRMALICSNLNNEKFKTPLTGIIEPSSALIGFCDALKIICPIYLIVTIQSLILNKFTFANFPIDKIASIAWLVSQATAIYGFFLRDKQLARRISVSTKATAFYFLTTSLIGTSLNFKSAASKSYVIISASIIILYSILLYSIIPIASYILEINLL